MRCAFAPKVAPAGVPVGFVGVYVLGGVFVGLQTTVGRGDDRAAATWCPSGINSDKYWTWFADSTSLQHKLRQLDFEGLLECLIRLSL